MVIFEAQCSPVTAVLAFFTASTFSQGGIVSEWCVSHAMLPLAGHLPLLVAPRRRVAVVIVLGLSVYGNYWKAHQLTYKKINPIARRWQRLGSCHKRQKPQAPTPQAPIRNRQTRKVANAEGLNRNINLT